MTKSTLLYSVAMILLAFSLSACVDWRLQQGVYRSTLDHMYMKQGRYKEAEKLFKEALEEEEKSPSTEFGGRLHWGNLDACLANLAECYQRQGSFSEAEVLYLREIDLLKQHKSESVIFPSRLIAIGKFYLQQNKLDQAQKIFEEVLSMPQSSDFGDSSKANCGLGEVYAARGNNKKADSCFREALKNPYNDSDKIAVWRSYALFLQHTNKLAESKEIETSADKLQKQQDELLAEQKRHSVPVNPGF